MGKVLTDSQGKVLTINGHPCMIVSSDWEPETYPATYEAVDLGLPSGTLWATANVGAGLPQQYGPLISWGDYEMTRTAWAWASYVYGTENNLTKYNASDGKTVLEAEDDIAFLSMGGNWHIPTEEQCQELIAGTDFSTGQVDGVAGCFLTSKTNGNSIFLPMSGLAVAQWGMTTRTSAGEGGGVWSSKLDTDKTIGKIFTFNNIGDGISMNGMPRNGGISARGVISPSATPSSVVRYYGTSKILTNNGVTTHDYYYAIVDESANVMRRAAMIQPVVDGTSGKTIMTPAAGMDFGPVTVQISEGDWVLFQFSGVNPTPIKLMPGAMASMTFTSSGSTIRMDYQPMTNGNKTYYVLRKKYVDGVLVADYQNFSNVFNQNLENLKTEQTDADGAGEIFHFVNRVAYAR